MSTSSFEQVLLYSGFVLQLFTILTVVGLFRLRRQGVGETTAWRSPWFPWVQLIFLFFNVIVLSFLLVDKPFESLLGLLNLAAGALSFAWEKWRYQPAPKPLVNQTEQSRQNGQSSNARSVQVKEGARVPEE